MIHKALKANLRIFFVIAIIVFLSGCETVPTLLQLNPSTYEDETIKIEYKIGVYVYFIRITNKTNNEIFINKQRASIISYRGETHNLNLSAKDSHIPPKSHIVLSSSTQTFFNTDFNSLFEKKHGYESVDYIPEEKYLKHFVNKSIRLFLPLQIKGNEKIYDIKLQVKGIEEK